MYSVSIHNMTSQFKSLLKEVLDGEEVVITHKNKPIAKLVPIKTNRVKPIFGSAKGLIEMSDDFDDPLEDFQEYM